MRRPISLVTAIAGAALLASAESAQAHIVAARLGDFYAGALHPLTDLQDIILWLALGVLAGSLGGSRGRWLVLLFPAGLLTGLILGLAVGVTSAGRMVDAAMIAAIGLTLAAAVRLPTVLLCIIAFAIAVMRGAVNADAIGPETNRVLFAAGLAAIGYAAITLIMAATLAFRRSDAAPSQGWRSIAIRAAGSWIAAVGLMLGGFALAS